MPHRCAPSSGSPMNINIKKSLSLSLFTLIIALFAVACGDDSSNNDKQKDKKLDWGTECSATKLCKDGLVCAKSGETSRCADKCEDDASCKRAEYKSCTAGKTFDDKDTKFCSKAATGPAKCAKDADCKTGEICITAGQHGNICTKSCTTTADCGSAPEGAPAFHCGELKNLAGEFVYACTMGGAKVGESCAATGCGKDLFCDDTLKVCLAECSTSSPSCKTGFKCENARSVRGKTEKSNLCLILQPVTAKLGEHCETNKCDTDLFCDAKMKRCLSACKTGDTCDTDFACAKDQALHGSTDKKDLCTTTKKFYGEECTKDEDCLGTNTCKVTGPHQRCLP